jgi:hypothetical protein
VRSNIVSKVRSIVFLVLLLVISSVSSAFAQPHRDTDGDPRCIVEVPYAHHESPVYISPNLASRIINQIEVGYYEADGYVINGAGLWYVLPKHAPGNEWTVGTGYVQAAHLVVQGELCGEYNPPAFQPSGLVNP